MSDIQYLMNKNYVLHAHYGTLPRVIYLKDNQYKEYCNTSRAGQNMALYMGLPIKISSSESFISEH